MNEEKGEFFERRRLLPRHNQRRLQIARRCPDFVDLCPFILAFLQSVQDEINNYGSVIVTPHYSDQEAQQFLFQTIMRELHKAPLASEKIRSRKRYNNISKRIM